MNSHNSLTVTQIKPLRIFAVQSFPQAISCKIVIPPNS